MCPSSKEDFTEFEKLLKEKITQFEKSVHYSSFLDSLFRELCISCKCSIFLIAILTEQYWLLHKLTVLLTLFQWKQIWFVTILLVSLTVEVDDLKKVSNSLSVLLSEKQKQEKVSDCMCILYFLIDEFWSVIFIQ